MVNDIYYRRRFLLVFLTLGIVILFIGRLFQLQLLDTDYKRRADNNAYFIKSIYPSRGVLYDRKGELLVSNIPAYDLMITMNEVGEKLDTLRLSNILGITPVALRTYLEEVKDRRKNRGYSRYTPQRLISQIDSKVVGRFQEQLFRFPGFSIQSRTLRSYNYHYAAHLLGYLGEASSRDIERDSLVALGDYVGKSGVERSYESILRGVKGEEILLRDARGRIKGRYNNGVDDKDPINGRDLTLSIDAGLQELGERMMTGKRGAIVAIEPETGEILAMVTAPNYDPALLSGKDKGVQHQLLEAEEGKPLLNRAIMGTYPPGSTFKPPQAAIFLADGVMSPSTRVSCFHGYPRLGGRPRCHSHAPNPDLVYSLITSCNAYYCWGMHFLLDDRKRFPNIETAFDHWKDRIVSLGFGYKLGVDMQGERRGYIPNSKIYDKLYKGRWNSSSIISISIGQGEVLATPLQIANVAAIVANRGRYKRPHIVRQIAQTPLDTAYTNWQDTHISPEYWEYVVAGMSGAVREGTCRAANFAPGEIEVCGKTGTAENPHGKDHSAFIGFAPREHPKIAISVYVENGGFGANFGVPIGRVMMEYYLRDGKLSASGERVAHSMSNARISYRYGF